MTNDTGRKWSDLSMLERFRLAWKQHGFDGSDMTTEHVFHGERKWRFDVAFPSQRLAIEFDGMGFGHQSTKGIRLNHEKQNEAVAMGWRVMRIDSHSMSMKRMPDFIDAVCRAMQVQT